MTLINFIIEWSEHHSAQGKLTLPDLISSSLFPATQELPMAHQVSRSSQRQLLSNQLQGYKCWVLDIQHMEVEINFFFFVFPGIKGTRVVHLNCTEGVWNKKSTQI